MRVPLSVLTNQQSESIAADVDAKVSRALSVVADLLLERTQNVLSSPADTRFTKFGRLVASSRARPGAPPRLVSGRLWGSGSVRKVGDRRWEVSFSTPYAVNLELGQGHPYLGVAVETHLGELADALTAELV